MSRPVREKKSRQRVLVVATGSPRPMRVVQRARVVGQDPVSSTGQDLDRQPGGVGWEAT